MISPIYGYSSFYSPYSQNDYFYKENLYDLTMQPNTKQDAQYADNVTELTTEMDTVDYLGPESYDNNNAMQPSVPPTTYYQQQNVLSLQAGYSMFENPGLLPYSYNEENQEFETFPTFDPPAGYYYDTYI